MSEKENLSYEQPLINYGSTNDSDNNIILNEKEEEIILYKYRFVVILLYFYHLCLTGGMQNTWAPIQDRVITVFGTTTTAVNWLALLYPTVNVLLSFFTGYTIERRGLHFTLGCATVVSVVGAWIRVLGVKNTNLWFTMLGQGIVAIGQPFALAASTNLSEAWYSEDGRAIATAVGGLAPIIGTVIASIVGPMFFDGVSCLDRDHNTDKLYQFVLYTAILVSIDCILMVLFMRNEPPTPPSYSSSQLVKIHQNHEDDLPVTEMLRRALSNPNFLLMMGGFGFGYAAVNMLTTLINQILHPLHYTDTQIGNIGAAIGCGIVGSVIVGALTDITKAFTLIVRTCSVFAAAGLTWFIYVLWSDPSTPHPNEAFASLAILGFFGVPLVPVILEIGVEVTYPLSEGVSTSMLWLAGNLFGMIAVLIGSAMEEDCISQSGPPDPNSCSKTCKRPETAMRNATYFLGALFGAAVLSTLFFNGRFKRLEAEQNHQRELEEKKKRNSEISGILTN